MRPITLRVALVAIGWLAAAVGLAQSPAELDGGQERREAALAITRAGAAEYEIRVGEPESEPLELKREPVFRWSNPEVGDVQGNVFVWTRAAKAGEARRPLVVGSLFHWFASAAGEEAGANRSTMEHEFHSLAEEPLAAKFHGEAVWTTSEGGVRFAPVPGAPRPAASEAQRQVQLKQLAKEFTGMGVFRTAPGELELRLLPQPLYRYAAADEKVLTGGLFAFVRATDPEILLLLEARSTDGGDTAGEARWQFAAARMHSMAQLWLEHQDERVWEPKPITIQETFEEHRSAYTAFKFKEIPDFLRDAVDE